MQKFYTGTVKLKHLGCYELAGFKHGKRLSQKQLEPLELNWLLIEHANQEKVLVVSVDALFSCNLLEEKIIKELNSQKIFVNGLYSVASHTHFAPAIDNSKPELGRADPKYISLLAKKTSTSITTEILASNCFNFKQTKFGMAICDQNILRRKQIKRIRLSPPFVETATVRAPNVAVAVPKSLRIWQVVDDQEQCRCVLVSWPCHAITRKDKHAISADFVGTLRKSIRKILGEQIAVLFLPGCSGDLRQKVISPLRSIFGLINGRAYVHFGSPSKRTEKN